MYDVHDPCQLKEVVLLEQALPFELDEERLTSCSPGLFYNFFTCIERANYKFAVLAIFPLFFFHHTLGMVLEPLVSS